MGILHKLSISASYVIYVYVYLVLTLYSIDSSLIRRRISFVNLFLGALSDYGTGSFHVPSIVFCEATRIQRRREDDVQDLRNLQS